MSNTERKHNFCLFTRKLHRAPLTWYYQTPVSEFYFVKKMQKTLQHKLFHMSRWNVFIPILSFSNNLGISDENLLKARFMSRNHVKRGTYKIAYHWQPVGGKGAKQFDWLSHYFFGEVKTSQSYSRLYELMSVCWILPSYRLCSHFLKCSGIWRGALTLVSPSAS